MGSATIRATVLAAMLAVAAPAVAEPGPDPAPVTVSQPAESKARDDEAPADEARSYQTFSTLGALLLGVLGLLWVRRHTAEL